MKNKNPCPYRNVGFTHQCILQILRFAFAWTIIYHLSCPCVRSSFSNQYSNILLTINSQCILFQNYKISNQNHNKTEIVMNIILN